MGYRNLQECVKDLERHAMLRRIDVPVDPDLEAGAIQRRVYAAGGPALEICKTSQPSGASWGADGQIVFGAGTKLWRVPDSGGVSAVRWAVGASGQLVRTIRGSLID